MQYADIIVDHPVSKKSLLTYAITSEHLSYIAIGSIVLVPLGKSTIHGVIVKLHRSVDAALKPRLKSIESVIYPSNFVPAYLVQTVFALEKKYGYRVSETLFRLLPPLPKRPQRTLEYKVEKQPGLYRSYSYQLSPIKRISFYSELWKRIKTNNQSLIILCASQDRVTVIAEAFQNSGMSVRPYPDGSPAQQRDYFLDSLTVGEPSIYIGTRGALMTSLNRVGAVVIDEPWLPGHKDDRSPRFWTAFIVSELCRSKSIPLFLVSSFIWPEDLLFKPKIKLFQPRFGQTHLLIDRSHNESVVEIQDIYANNPGSLQITYNPIAESHYWCNVCKMITADKQCSTCQLPTKYLPVWRKEDIDQTLNNITPPAIYSLSQLALLKPSDAIISFGMDALLAITDYRSSLYLSTLLSYLLDRSKIFYLVTRNPEAWTTIVEYMKSYNVENELLLRRNHHLPPYSIPIRLQGLSQEKIEAYCESIKIAILYRGVLQKKGNEYALFLLIDSKQYHILPLSNKSGVIVDLYPNYIDSSIS